MATQGRPTEYDDKFPVQAAKLCELGATDDELADFFNVHRATIYRWKHEYPEFCDSIKSGKVFADERVERSLYQKATGYNVTEEVAVKLKEDQHKEIVEVVQLEKHVPAETTAAIFWLKNRRSQDWRDKQEVGVTDKDGNDVIPDSLDIARRLAFLLKKGEKDV